MILPARPICVTYRNSYRLVVVTTIAKHVLFWPLSDIAVVHMLS